MPISESKVDVLSEAHQSNIEDKQALLNDSIKFIDYVSDITKTYCHSVLQNAQKFCFGIISEDMAVSLNASNVQSKDNTLSMNELCDVKGQDIDSQQGNSYRYWCDVYIEPKKVCDISRMSILFSKIKQCIPDIFSSNSDVMCKWESEKSFCENLMKGYTDKIDDLEIDKVTDVDIYNAANRRYKNAILFMECIKKKVNLLTENCANSVATKFVNKFREVVYEQDVKEKVGLIHLKVQCRDNANTTVLIDRLNDTASDRINEKWQDYCTRNKKNCAPFLYMLSDFSLETDSCISIASMKSIILDTICEDLAKKQNNWFTTKDPEHLTNDGKQQLALLIFMHFIRNIKLTEDYHADESFNLSAIISKYDEAIFLLIQYCNENQEVFYYKDSNKMKESVKWVFTILDECFHCDNISKRNYAVFLKQTSGEAFSPVNISSSDNEMLIKSILDECFNLDKISGRENEVSLKENLDECFNLDNISRRNSALFLKQTSDEAFSPVNISRSDNEMCMKSIIDQYFNSHKISGRENEVSLKANLRVNEKGEASRKSFHDKHSCNCCVSDCPSVNNELPSDQDSKSAFLEEKDVCTVSSIFDDLNLSSIAPNMGDCCEK